MSEEALDIIVKAWTQDEVTYQGKYWQFDEALPVPKPYQQPHPPIWVAAHSPSALEFAARHNYHVSQNIDVDAVIAEKFDYYRRVWRECQHPGPMPRTFLTRAVHVAETDAIARAEAETASTGVSRRCQGPAHRLWLRWLHREQPLLDHRPPRASAVRPLLRDAA
jgi:alkanesulfonate monooxygenase SsuD/methylene tetrahydromethanopterin reductase-like flavin-dependent oxidoreductase (luciferase family)